MEFVDVGAHCAVQLCRQRDFLPFKCDCCAATFCLEHRSYASHGCAKAAGKDARAVVCPLCAATIHFKEGQGVHAQFEAHVASVCTPAARAARVKKEKCGAAGCREKLLLSNRARCSDCGAEFCLAHRYPDEHACKGRAANAGGNGSVGGFLRQVAAAVSGGPAPAPARQPPARSAAAQAAAAAAEARAAKAAPVKAPARHPSATSAASSSLRPAAAQAAVDPGNSVRGTAARRMQGGGSSDGGGAAASAASSTSLPGFAAPRRGDDNDEVTVVSSGPEACPHCPARFANVAALIAHAESAHSGVAPAPPAASGGAERCPQCGRGFASLQHLIAHAEEAHSQSQQQQQQQQRWVPAGVPSTSDCAIA